MTLSLSEAQRYPFASAAQSHPPSTEWSDLFAQIYAERNPRIFPPRTQSRPVPHSDPHSGAGPSAPQ
jgi:hypothetical protein